MTTTTTYTGMVEEKGVLCIPSGPFFSEERYLEGAADEFVRVAFCKSDETIEAAAAAFVRSAKTIDDNTNDQDVVAVNDVERTLPIDANVTVI